jgi:hypothetical protein
VLATLVGGAARVGTVRWGHPFLFHPDERAFVMYEAATVEWRAITYGDWRPRTTSYGPFVYELAVVLKWMFDGGYSHARQQVERYDDELSYAAAGGPGPADPSAPFSLLRWTHLVRLAGAIGATIAIALMGVAAWTLAGARAGAMTAWLAAMAAGLIQVSHFATTDSLLLLWAAMLLHACARIARGGGLGAAAYAGVALGLMAATKMPGVVLGAALPVAIAASPGARGALSPDRRGAWHWALRTLRAAATGRFLLSVAVAMVVFVALCPWAFFETDVYFATEGPRSGRDMLMVQYTEHDYAFWDWRFDYNGTPHYLYLLTHVLPYAVGVPVMIAGFLGSLRGVREDRVAARLALAAWVPTFLLVGSWGVQTIRFAIPMVPGLLLGAGLFCAEWWDRGRLGRAIAIFVIAAGAARGAAFTGMFLEDDPRVLAGRWLLDHAQRGDTIVMGPEAPYSPPLGLNEDGVGVERPPVPGVRVLRLWQSRPSDVAQHVDSLLVDARYLVIDDFYLRRGLHPEADRRAPAQATFYRALLAGETGYELVASFEREPRLGPLVWHERDADTFAVVFDHMPVWIYERRGEYRSPFPAR